MSEPEAQAVEALLAGTAVPGIRGGGRRILGFDWAGFDEAASHTGADVGVADALNKGQDGDGFSFAVNFHAFGKYVNVPYSCKAKGVPPPPQWEVFSEVASSMAKSAGYTWGQSWCQRSVKMGAKACVNSVGLYPVAGEMSDWMLAKHGVFAMSPEVAPEWPFRGGDGFWPPHKLEHQIIFSLLSANLLVAWRAGADHTLRFKWHANPITCVDATVTVKNIGVRSSAGGLNMRLSVNADGSAAADGSTVGFSSSVCTGSDGVTSMNIVGSDGLYARASTQGIVVHARVLQKAVPVYYAALFDDTVCTVYSIAGTAGVNVEGAVVQRAPAAICSGFGAAKGDNSYGRTEGAVAYLHDVSS
jgi:hypothetical protein